MSSVDETSAAKTTYVESQPTAVANEAATLPAARGDGVSDIVRPGKREDLLMRSSLCLRGIALLFSLIALILTATNNKPDLYDFIKLNEGRYILAVTVTSTAYTIWQVLRQVLKLPDVKDLLHPETMLLIDFLGDQIIAYLLISAASAAVPVTNALRELSGGDISSDYAAAAIVRSFSDSAAAAISMSFLAFICLAPSALISFYRLSTHSSI